MLGLYNSNTFLGQNASHWFRQHSKARLTILRAANPERKPTLSPLSGSYLNFPPTSSQELLQPHWSCSTLHDLRIEAADNLHNLRRLRHSTFNGISIELRLPHSSRSEPVCSSFARQTRQIHRERPYRDLIWLSRSDWYAYANQWHMRACFVEWHKCCLFEITIAIPLGIWSSASVVFPSLYLHFEP